MEKIALTVPFDGWSKWPSMDWSHTTSCGLGGGRGQEERYQRANAPPLKDVQPGRGGGHVHKYTNKCSTRVTAEAGSWYQRSVKRDFRQNQLELSLEGCTDKV